MKDEQQPQGAPLVEDKAVLLVEDDADLLGVTTQILQHFGFTVHAFADGGVALQWFNQHYSELDLAILDRRLPSIGGGALFRVMHVMAPKLPIILYSGDVSVDDERQLSSEGIALVLRKPLGIKNFQRAIREVLGLPGNTTTIRKS